MHLQSPAPAWHLDLRFAAGQLAWVSVRSDSPAAAAIADGAAADGALPPPASAAEPKQEAAPAAARGAGQSDLGLPQLFRDLAQQHAAVSLPAEAAAGGPVAQPNGVWVHRGAALQAVVAAVLAHLAQRMP